MPFAFNNLWLLVKKKIFLLWLQNSQNAANPLSELQSSASRFKLELLKSKAKRSLTESLDSILSRVNIQLLSPIYTIGRITKNILLRVISSPKAAAWKSSVQYLFLFFTELKSSLFFFFSFACAHRFVSKRRVFLQKKRKICIPGQYFAWVRIDESI